MSCKDSRTDDRSWFGAIRQLVLIALTAGLAACGGGGGNTTTTITNNPSGGSWTAGVYQPAASFAAQCANPRTGINPRTGSAYPDVQGSTLSENNWLRSWTNELYLWYDEVPDLNPAAYSTAGYFDVLKTPATTPSGQPKDKFHFTYRTSEWEALSQSGIEIGYGAEWLLFASTPPRRIAVAYIEPGSPAAAANLARGDEILVVDGADFVNGNTQTIVDTLNAGIFPAAAGGNPHTFTIRDVSGATREISMTPVEVTRSPVQNVRTLQTNAGLVGYLLFNDHIATAESALIDAVATLSNAGIQDLIVDIRYNGGGFLAIASELAYMIAGSVTAGREFERMTFSTKHPTTNPVTGQALSPTPFFSTRQFTTPATALPTLNLSRVFVITGTGTCSASESIINSLRGIDIEVIQIGSSTCGKPYGFYAFDNCGTTYFSIQFKSENAKGFSDYSDGFSPNNSTGVVGERIPGCSVADDLTHALGDPDEGRLAAALEFLVSNGATCPSASGFAPGAQLKPGQSREASDGSMIRSPWRENRILE